MDKKTVFVKTSKGAGEASNQSDHLYGDAKRVLLLVDDDSTVAEITKRAPPSLRATLESILEDLVSGGFIRDSKAPENAPTAPSSLKIAAPKFATPKAAPQPVAPQASASEEAELDFSFLGAASASKPEPPKTAAARPESSQALLAEQQAAAERAAAEARAKQEADARAKQEAAAKAQAEARAKQEALAKAQAQAQAEVKAKQEAELARVRAAQQAQIEAQATAAKAKAYADAKARAKAEVEARARAEADAREKQAVEAARIKAEKEAEAARAELEAAKAKAEAEMRARAIAAAKIKQEAEAARLKAEAEAARAKAELEAAKAKMEAEMRARLEAEARAKQEAEQARLKAEQEAERVRAELEAARLRAEAEARAKIELEARLKAEAEAAQERARLEEAKAKLEAEAKSRLEAEQRMKAEIEARLQQEAEAKSRLEAEQRMRAEIEARLQQEADEARQKKEREALAVQLSLDAERAKAELEARLKVEAEARIRAEVEARIQQEEEAARLQAAKVLVELDAVKTKAEADAKALVEAAARVKAEAEAEARLKQEQEEAARRAEEERRREEQARAEAEARRNPADKIRESFAKSAAGRGRDASAGDANFKFDSFAVGGSDQPESETARTSADETPVISLNFDAISEIPTGSFPTPGIAKAKLEEEKRQKEEAQRRKAEQEAARLKAEQEAAQRKAEQEEAARRAAEQEAARLKAEHEAYKAKVEQEEARARAEEEARKQAAEQSKAWEEAEQRARAKAEAEKERQARVQAEAEVKAAKVPKARRKPLPVGKIVAGLAVLAVLVVVALPYLWPLGSYVAPLEKELSAKLGQPVHLGPMSGSWSPAPKVEIRDVTVGAAKELKVGRVEVIFDFSALFSPTHSISELKLVNVSLNGGSVIPAAGWLRASGGLEKYPVAKIELEGLQVATEEIKVPSLSGEAKFDSQGNFTKGELKSEGNKLSFELAAVDKHLQLVVNFRDATLPTLPNIPFKDLTATGEILNGEIAFSDLYGHVYGGMLGGNARLNWSNGWLLQGRLVAKSFELEQFLPQYGLSGELYGDVNFTLSGDRLSRISEAPRLDGTFEAKQITINKVDLETLARFGNRSDMARGRTNFDGITGTIQADSVGQHLRQLKLVSSAMHGTGLLDVGENQEMSGKLSLDLKGPHGGDATIILSGTAKEPAVRVR